MSELIDWFAGEIRELGFAGLEGVYDYVATMSDAQVVDYLESLLGSEKRIKEFVNSYIQRRSLRKQNAASRSSSSHSHFDSAQTAHVPPKAKRNRGKDRQPGKERKQSQRENKSFAKVASNVSATVSNTEQARVIRDAPVERMRQQVREYRKTKRPINCIHCGKIECPIQEDGACSFCGSPIFSIWEPSEKQQDATRLTKRHPAGKGSHINDMTKYCTVFGRYVRRPVRSENIYLQPELRDLAGNKRGAHLASMEEAKNMAQSTAMSDDQSSSALSPSSNDFAFSVQGRLLVDDLRPSVCLPDP